ncbi:aminotransferase class V-fold PLP-dependent enzyme [Demequina capsici]|uniref:Aminotransferase class V-fold PLP-dependent enzyme n=1 Tax=Demequina capsici TaxID=3075620 RepID=A0AA96FCW3_9MICO|nr:MULTISPECIES: aminotransferase class V-fold PLP-dependent enzyme [unclassified Demequina]WNM25671.1 aminotransferase class V-fold PLP-dependent enzyme [Demequina sp. OYTSA14]WNM28566.1 aminotransferase class V-fold PLP-dependent enzyme [Demequina sp. PMTSA13]
MALTRTYLDASGSSPMTPRVLEAIRAGFADGWADPRRLHAESRRAQALVEGAREAIAEVLGCPTHEVAFSPSAVIALERTIGAVHTARRGRERIVASAVERDATLHAAHYYAQGRLETVAVDEQGHLDLEAFAAALDYPDVTIAAVQHVNHELGTAQRLDDVHEIAKAHEVPLVVDATASIGHMESPAAWDALVANPADWGGPAGIGVLAIRSRTRWLPAWPERSGWEAGGISVPLVLAAAVALQERVEHRQAVEARMRAMTEWIRSTAATMPGVTVVGDPLERAPHLVTLLCSGVDGEAVLARLDKEGIAVGSGSACEHDGFEPSRVLAAIGSPSTGNVRIGLHPGVDEPMVDRFLALLPRIIGEARADAGLGVPWAGAQHQPSWGRVQH